MSLDEIRQEAIKEIEFLEGTAARKPASEWPRPMLAFAREFHTLTSNVPLDGVRIRDFGARLQRHIQSERLKGMEPFVWRAEALAALAKRGNDT